MGKISARAALLAAASTFIWPTVAASQQGGFGANPGGVQVDLGVSTSMTADSNFPLDPGKSKGTSYISDTTLTFGLSSVNSAYTFSLDGSGVLRYADLPVRTVRGFEDPSLNGLFVASSSNSQLTAYGRWQKADREFLDPFQVDQEDLQNGLITNGGTQTTKNYGLRFQGGLTDPFGYGFDISRNERDYSGVRNVNIFNTKTDKASVTTTFKFNPVTTGSISAGWTHYTAEDFLRTDRTTRDFSVGVLRELDKTLVLDAQIGYTKIKEDLLGRPSSQGGATGALTLTKSVTDGTIFGTFATTRNQNGGRTELSFGRDMILPTGTLRGVIGVSDSELGSNTIIGSLAYVMQTRSDTFSVNLDRTASTSGTNQEIVDTVLSVNWTRPVDAISSVNLGLNVARSEDAGNTGAPTIQLTELRASYDRNLTTDWVMSSGIDHRFKTETGLADARSTSVFVSLGRNFSFRP